MKLDAIFRPKSVAVIEEAVAVAENFVGAFELTAGEIELFRQFNPDFFAATGQNMLITGDEYDDWGERLVSFKC